MLFVMSMCAVEPQPIYFERRTGLKKIHNFALIADEVLAIALLIIGICATQWGFLPTSLQYAFIGAGSVFALGLVTSFLGWIKDKTMPNCFLIKHVPPEKV